MIQFIPYVRSGVPGETLIGVIVLNATKVRFGFASIAPGSNGPGIGSHYGASRIKFKPYVRYRKEIYTVHKTAIIHTPMARGGIE